MTAVTQVLAKDSRGRRTVAVWLLIVAALVIAMIVLGGATRLTQSGLSMVRWQPVTGVFPPFSEQAWQEEFAQYQKYPEYQKINRGMGLTEFKAIFWFEYSHRLLGRLIGLAFALPYLWFLFRGQLRGRLAWQLGGVFFLGGIQGLVGWWMVKSGLVDHPDVSQYRLAIHLALALAILAFLLWFAWRQLYPQVGSTRGQVPRRLAWTAVLLTYFQALSGALVAGLDAGRHYNTFPLMNGSWVPDEIWFHSPGWRNLFENPTTVQFDHRIGAYLVAILIIWLWWQGRRTPDAEGLRRACNFMALAVAIQIGLGIATLVYMVPVTLGILHQTGALVVFTTVLFVAFRMRSDDDARAR